MFLIGFQKIAGYELSSNTAVHSMGKGK